MLTQQQSEIEIDDINLCQADFIATWGYNDDHKGMLAVSYFGCDDALVQKYEAENDDSLQYKIMSRALVDRFVEAFVLYLLHPQKSRLFISHHMLYKVLVPTSTYSTVHLYNTLRKVKSQSTMHTINFFNV